MFRAGRLSLSIYHDLDSAVVDEVAETNVVT